MPRRITKSTNGNGVGLRTYLEAVGPCDLYGNSVQRYSAYLTTEEQKDRWQAFYKVQIRMITDAPGATGPAVWGVITGWLLTPQTRRAFYDLAQEVAPIVADFMFECFDRYGYLKPELKQGGPRMGSGVWDDILSEGSLLFIDKLQLSHGVQEKPKIRAALIKTLIEQGRGANVRDCYNVVIPGSILQEDRPHSGDGPLYHNQWNEEGGMRYICETFRRIGNTDWFGYCLDYRHPTRSPIENYPHSPSEIRTPTLGKYVPDYTAVNLFDTSLPEYSHESAATVSERISSRQLYIAALPLHYQVLTSPEDGGDLAKCLEEWKDSAVFERVDQRGNNVLAFAACLGRWKWVFALLTSQHKAKLQSMRNRCGETPLEALRHHLEETRTQQKSDGHGVKHISETFRGHPANLIQCLILLQDWHRPLCEDDYRRLESGCTCGSCIDGYLSRSTLDCLAGAAKHFEDMFMSCVHNRRNLDSGARSSLWVHVFTPAINTALFEAKPLRRGVMTAVEAIRLCCKAGIAPTLENVQTKLNIWVGGERNEGLQLLAFPEAYRCLIKIIISRAHERTTLVRGFQVWGETTPRACRNDWEYEFVQGMLTGHWKVDKGFDWNVAGLGLVDAGPSQFAKREVLPTEIRVDFTAGRLKLATRDTVYFGIGFNRISASTMQSSYRQDFTQLVQSPHQTTSRQPRQELAEITGADATSTSSEDGQLLNHATLSGAVSSPEDSACVAVATSPGEAHSCLDHMFKILEATTQTVNADPVPAAVAATKIHQDTFSQPSYTGSLGAKHSALGAEVFKVSSNPSKAWAFLGLGVYLINRFKCAEITNELPRVECDEFSAAFASLIATSRRMIASHSAKSATESRTHTSTLSLNEQCDKRTLSETTGNALSSRKRQCLASE